MKVTIGNYDRKYVREVQIRNQERSEYFSLQGQLRARVVTFPTFLKEVPPFPIWIKTYIVIAIKEGDIIDKDIMHMSMPPMLEAKSYRAMWAFGNHICVSSAEEHLITCDSGVEATFEQECVLGPNDQRLVLAKLECVGWVEEIL